MPTSAIPLQPRPDGRQSETAASVCIGARRLLAGHGFATVTELTLRSGRRADIVGVGRDGSIWIVEIKSSLADYRADGKWPEYRDFCDRLFFAVPADFRTDVLPDDAGWILADAFGAALVRQAPEHRLPGARRKAVVLRFAHVAANRHHGLVDPSGVAGWMD